MTRSERPTHPEAAAKLVMGSRYTEYAPVTELQPFVECFWTRETVPAVRPAAPAAPAAMPLVHRVLPDGCIDVVLGFSGGRDEPDTAMVVGTMTRALVLDAASSPDCFVGVRFRPAKATAFLDVPASELTDRRVTLEDVWRDGARVRERVAGASGVQGRVQALERAVTARLSPRVGAHQRDVDEAVRRIVAAGGSLGITRLAPSLGVTRQHLARRFAQLVGVSPKVFSRVVRLSRVIERARLVPPSDPLNWSGLALELGYYDQSHLVDEFREMTGITPTVWRDGLR